MTKTATNKSVRLMAVFGLASLAAVGLGAAVCALSGVSAASWGRNLAAWLVGAVIAAALAAAGRRVVSPEAALTVAGLAVTGLAASFFNPAQEGVHRWIDAGPLHVNIAMVVLPSLSVVLAAAEDRRAIWGAAVAALILLVAQPDASQTTTLAAVLILVAAFSAPGRGVKAALILFAGVAAAAAWMRPDPLQPVAEVEEIVGLAFQVSPLIGSLALILLAAFAAVPATLTRPDARLKLAGAALSLCLAAWAVTPLFGAFPVPLVGVGMSPILGAWLGVGLLAAATRARTP
jgi:cell division protein FtsW (lipid II flippase)